MSSRRRPLGANCTETSTRTAQSRPRGVSPRPHRPIGYGMGTETHRLPVTRRNVISVSRFLHGAGMGVAFQNSARPLAQARFADRNEPAGRGRAGSTGRMQCARAYCRLSGLAVVPAPLSPGPSSVTLALFKRVAGRSLGYQGHRRDRVRRPADSVDAVVRGVLGQPEVTATAQRLRPAHMPFFFPEVSLREEPGFNVLWGNPP